MPLALLLILALLLLLAATVWQLASMLLHPPRMTDGKALYVLRRMSPGDLGLPFEPTSFDVVDEVDGQRLRIAAWWIEARDPSVGRTVIITHGYGDAKVGGIAWAPLLRDLGFHVLAIDLRAHGESGGTRCTGGDRETGDLVQVVHQLRARRPRETASVVLFGISLGGAVSLAAAAQDDVQVDAVIADSVFADFVEAAKTHARLIGAPARLLHGVAVRFGIWRAGARVERVRPIDTVRAARCPVMIVHGDADPFVPADHREQLAAAIAARNDPRSTHVVVNGAGHCMPMVADVEAYRARIERFMSAAH